MNLSRLLFAGVAAFCAWPACAQTPVPAPTLRSLDEPDPEREARVAWHHAARFGCFLHWGVYSAVGGEWPNTKPGTYSEHLMRWAKIPRAVYVDKVVKPFDPAKFDAETWVRLFQDAGMRYVIITAKHHDGFAMYPSKVSPYNITLTHCQRDPMRELRDACARHGLKFGFYYSHAFDWEHPDAPGNDWDYDNPGGDKKLGGPEWWDGPRADFLTRARRYVDEKSIPQIRELITMYHPDILWFDTPSKLPPDENTRILAAVRAADPHVVVNGRLVRSYGDYKNTADRPAEIPYTDGHWEGIPTTNESYGWSRIDHSHKPPEHFIVLLAKTVSKGGNMLLNVGPMGTGEIDPIDATILHGIGAWMSKNSASIYGCDRTPLAVQSWGTSTWNDKSHSLYLHVFHWPKDGKLLVSGLQSDPTAAAFLANADAPKPNFKRLNVQELEVTLPPAAPDPVDTVIRLDFPGPITASFARRIPGSEPTTLHVMDGQLAGKGVRYGDGKRNNDCTLEWRSTDGGIDWPVRVPTATRFRIVANYATATAKDGGTAIITAGNQTLTAPVAPTNGATAYQSATLGELDFSAGVYTLMIRPKQITGENLMKLRTLELVPVR